MPRIDEPVVEEFRLGVERDEIADVDAEFACLLEARRAGVDPQLDIAPADGQRVDLVVEGMARGLERQHRAAVAALLRVDGDARAFSEARRPVADRCQFGATILLDQLDLRAEGVEMGDDRPRAIAAAALPHRADGTATGKFRLQAQLLQLRRAVADNGVGISGGAVYREQRLELLDEVSRIDIELDHGSSLICPPEAPAPRLSGRTSGKGGRQNVPPWGGVRGLRGRDVHWPR